MQFRIVSQQHEGFRFPCMMSKVEEELKRMEDAGIISKVTERIDWCAHIVTAFKNSDIRL
jgi:hypothetical protein